MFQISGVAKSNCKLSNLTLALNDHSNISDGPVVPALGFYSSDTDSVTIHYIVPELPPAQLEKVTYYLQYRLDGVSSSPWHEVHVKHIIFFLNSVRSFISILLKEPEIDYK